jgi:hypothetical protein
MEQCHAVLDVSGVGQWAQQKERKNEMGLYLLIIGCFIIVLAIVASEDDGRGKGGFT